MLNRKNLLLIKASVFVLTIPGLTLPSLMFPGLALADEAPTEVVVSITRENLPVSKLGQSVDVLTDSDIRTYQSLQISDLLARTTDLSLSRNGGPGQAATTSIRGAGGDHTLYLLDGVRLNDPSQVGGGTNLGLLSTDDAARIEVLRGPLSTLWGSGALGGVVSITSRAPSQALEGDLRVEGFDEYGTARLGLGGQVGKLSWRVYGSTQNDRGVSAFAGGTEKDGFGQTTLSGKLSYALTDTLTVKAFSSKVHSRNDYDGFPAPLYAFADTGDFGKTDTTMNVLAVTHRFAAGEQTLSISETDNDRHDFNPDHTPNFVATGHIQSADYHVTYRLTPQTRLLGGLSYERDTMQTASPASWDPNPTPQKASSNLSSLYGQLSHDFGAVSTALSLRHDDASSFGGQDIAQLSVSVPVTDQVRLHASAGQGVKVPSLYQLYSDYGNTDLKPETAVTLDAGVDYTFEKGQFGVTAFTRRVDDQIDFFSGCYADPTIGLCPTRPYGYYANIARTEARGIELEGAYAFSETLSLRGNYSFLHTENRSAGFLGNRLPRIPRQLGSIDMTWIATAQLSLSAGARYASDRFDDVYNATLLKSYGLIDLRADYALNERISLYGRIENVGDTRYETAANYGQVGRRVWIGIHTRLF